MNVNYDELIIVAGGLFLAIFGNAKRNERSELIKKGIRVEGTVFDLEKEDPLSITVNVSNDASGMRRNYYPVIRYVTNQKKWVTKRYEIGSNPPAYRVGDSVNVIYDPDNTAHFIIENDQAKFIWPVLMIAGLAMVVGVVMYFFIRQFPCR